jgi:hypothetical protein
LAKLSYCADEVFPAPGRVLHARCLVLIGSNSFVGPAVQSFALHLLRLPRSLDVGDEVRNSIANLAGTCKQLRFMAAARPWANIQRKVENFTGG